jgi:hypothetical protein
MCHRCMALVTGKVCTLALQQALLSVAQAVSYCPKRSKVLMVSVVMLVQTAGVAAIHALSSKTVTNCCHCLLYTTAKAHVSSIAQQQWQWRCQVQSDTALLA